MQVNEFGQLPPFTSTLTWAYPLSISPVWKGTSWQGQAMQMHNTEWLKFTNVLFLIRWKLLMFSKQRKKMLILTCLVAYCIVFDIEKVNSGKTKKKKKLLWRFTTLRENYHMPFLIDYSWSLTLSDVVHNKRVSGLWWSLWVGGKVSERTIQQMMSP